MLASFAVPAAFSPITLPATIAPDTVTSTRTPSDPLPEIRLPAPGSAPPICVSDDVLVSCTPKPVLGAATSPAALVPIRLPRTVVRVAVPDTCTPLPVLPAITLPAPAAVPPTTWSEPLTITMPLPPLPTAAVPAAFRPMTFPCTTLPVALSRRTPLALLPDSRLPAPGAVPPIVMPEAPETAMPWPAVPAMRAPPLGSSPNVLPWTTVFEPFGPM